MNSVVTHDVLLSITIFSTAAKQALCEGSPVYKATAPLPCSGDIASVLSQCPNEYLEKNKSATSFCSLQLLAVFIHAHISLLPCNGKVDSPTVNKMRYAHAVDISPCL